MKTLIIFIAKKYALSAINDLLKQYSTNVFEVTSTLDIWIERLQKIVKQLKAINKRVSDGKIDNEDIDVSIEEIKELMKDF